MEKVRIITLKDYSETVLKTLQKIGVLHIEEAKELKPVDREALENAAKEVKELFSFVTTILSYIPEGKKTLKGVDFDVMFARPFREISDEVKLLYNKASTLSERITRVDAEAVSYKDLKKYLEVLPGKETLRLTDLNYTGAVISSRVFVMPYESYKSAEDKFQKYIFVNSAVEVGDEVVVHAVIETANQKTVETIVADSDGRTLTIPPGNETITEFLKSNDAKIAEFDAKMVELKKDLEAKVSEDVERLILLREALAAENDRLSVLGKAAEAKYITLIEGWVPKPDMEKLLAEIKQEVDYAFVDSRDPDSAEQPPTKQDNFEVVTPFSLIVGLFGTPKYREWDPTPIVAYSFAFFFGIMTNDVLYALGIAAFTKWILPKFVEDVNSEGVRLFRRVLYTGAIVSGILGLLGGSWFADFFPKVFGFEMWSFSPVATILGNPIFFIIAAAVIGFFHVNIAHVFTFVQAIQAKNKGVIVTKVGFFAMQIFVILLGVALVGIVPAMAGIQNIFLYGTYGSLLVLIIGVIMQMSYFGVLMWVFEVTGLVGDILSYTRLAGVGLAGFYLGKSINMMSNVFMTIIPGPIGLVIGILMAIGVLIVGHAINTVLSIQGGFVHSMRLCLVEFMFKFYEGGGSRYSPFSLKTSRSLLIKEKA